MNISIVAVSFSKGELDVQFFKESKEKTLTNTTDKGIKSPKEDNYKFDKCAHIILTIWFCYL